MTHPDPKNCTALVKCDNGRITTQSCTTKQPLIDDEKNILCDMHMKNPWALVEATQAAVIKRLAAGVSVEPEPRHELYRQQAREAIRDGGWAKAIRDCLPVAEYFIGKHGEVQNPTNLGNLVEQDSECIGVLFTLDQLTTALAAARVAENERCAKFAADFSGMETARAIRALLERTRNERLHLP